MVHDNKKTPGRHSHHTPGSNNSSLLDHHHTTPPAPPQQAGNNGGPPSSSSSSVRSTNSHSNSSPNGGGARQTGTVPKTKASRKNSVPQEVVAPTRRDLQQHLTELVHWASTAPSPTNSNTPGQQQQQRGGGGPASSSISSAGAGTFKQRNIRTPGEGTCFDLDNLSLQDHAASSRFIPVRPIVRGSYLAEEEQHLPTSHSNTTIGVVIPTTPSQQQQQQNHQDSNIWQHIISPVSRQRPGSEARSTAFRIIPDGAPSQPTTTNHSSNRGNSRHRTAVNSTNRQLDDRILEIQDYIRATSSLINTINQEKIENNDGSEMVNEHLDLGRPINSINLETLADSGGGSEINGPRPQSVASIHSTPTPGTPDYDDLQQKLQSSNRSMQMIRDQQNQIIRMQQTAKAQLEDMEKERAQNATSSLLSQEEPPNYEDVNEVQDDVSSLMNRMRSLSTFVDNQNELANMLGEDMLSDEILEEQAMLHKKVQELKSKRGQMVDLVNELQSMNTQAELSFNGQQGQDSQMSGGMEMPVNQMGNLVNHQVPCMERIVPIEVLSGNSSAGLQHQLQNANSGASLNSEATLINCNDLESEAENHDSELFESESLASSGQNNSVVSEKMAEITAMKEQLKRLQNMMNTVKLIENKVNGPDPVEMAEATREVDRLLNEVPQPRRNIPVIPEKPQPEPTPVMNVSEMDLPVLSDRVNALHAMTADLRAQALSLAAERDRIRTIKDEVMRRNAEEREERESERSNSTIRESAAGAASLDFNNHGCNVDRAASEQRKLKEEFELKKREYETVLEKIQNAGRQSQPRHLDLFGHSDVQEVAHNGLTKKMQNDQMGMGLQSPGASSVPWRRTSSTTTQIQPQQHQQQQQQQLPTQQQMTASIAQLQNHQSLFEQQQSVNANGTPNYSQTQADHNNMWMGNGQVEGLTGYRGDSLLLQQFIQTQQMLINSISQCNQLLWAQQRELNNLNNAVLMLQERLLKHELSNTTGDTSLNMSGQNLMGGSNNRSESVPPPHHVGGLLAAANVNASNLMHQGGIPSYNSPISYLRAQSEQPSSVGAAGPFWPHNHNTSTANFGNAPQTPLSPVRIHPMFNNQSMLRNGSGGHQQIHATPSNLIHLNNNLGSNNTNNLNNANMNNITNNLANNRIARVTGNVQMPHMQGGGNSQNNVGGSEHHHLFGNNILNFNPMNNNLNANVGSTNLDHLPPIHHHFGGHHLGGHNMQSNPHLMNHGQQPTLNNQVAPGNRANNYWDNFRSYSRQNLLSGNSCKSNEESCASSTSNYQPSFVPTTTATQQQPQQLQHRISGSAYSIHAHPNQHQQQLHQSSVQQVLDGKGFQQHYRNTLMEMQQQTGSADYGLNNNYSQNPLNNNNLNSIVNNFGRNRNNHMVVVGDHLQQSHAQDSSAGAHGTSFPPTNMTLAADILGFHTNPINLGVNAEFAPKSKTLPKTKKRARPMMANNNPDSAPLVMPATSRSTGNEVEEEDNLNLASATSTNVRSKSTSKFFEALKENVRCEVSALIETNDLRPYFLIQLFRDLQLMCSSDPTRHQTLQSIQNMYNRYVESTIQEEVTMFGGTRAVDCPRTLEVEEEDDEGDEGEEEDEENRQNMSNDDVDNRMLVNDLRMEAKTENDLATQNRETSRRDEDCLRRQNKRRYRNRVNEIASKQNFLEQRLGLSIPTSSGSSHSTPIRSVFNDMLQMPVNGHGLPTSSEQYVPQATSSSDSSLSVSTDCEIIRIVVKEITEYLQSIEPINTLSEVILQRIATIVISHLNNALNERLLFTNVRRIDREELMVQLRAFAVKRNKFLKRIENYLRGRFVDITDAVAGTAERDFGGDNQEVLQKSQKKLNNDPGGESQPKKETKRNCSNNVVELPAREKIVDIEGAAASDAQNDLEEQERIIALASISDEVAREEGNGAGNIEAAVAVAEEKDDAQAQEDESIRATDE